MRRHALLPLLAAALLFGTLPAHAELVSYWTFDDGTFSDTVGSNDPSIVGDGVYVPPLLQGPTGAVARYAAFDGTTSADLGIAHSASLKPSTALTLEAWVKSNDIHTQAYTEIYRKEDGNARHLFSFQSNGTLLALGLGTSSYSEYEVPIAPAMFEDGQWHHVAATYDSATSTPAIYIDGAAQTPSSSGSFSGAIQTTGSAPAFIGSNNGGSEHFNGAIDEVALWNEALNATTIAEHCALAQKRISYTTQAYWKMDAPAGLDSADAHNASAIGAGITPTPTGGAVNGFYDFNGATNADMPIPHSPALKPADELTIEAWIKPQDIHGPHPGGNTNYEIYRKEDGNDRHLFSFQNAGTILSLGLGRGNPASYAEFDLLLSSVPGVTDYTYFEDGQWHHVAASYDGATARIYIDGTEAGSTSWTGALATGGAAPVYIGSNGGGSEHFDGGIDEVAVWSQAIPSSLIAQHYDLGKQEGVGYFADNTPAVVRLGTDILGDGQTVTTLNPSIDATGEIDATPQPITSTGITVDFTPYGRSVGTPTLGTHEWQMQGNREPWFAEEIWLPGAGETDPAPDHNEGIGGHAEQFVTFDLDEIRNSSGWAGQETQFSTLFGKNGNWTYEGSIIGTFWLDGELVRRTATKSTVDEVPSNILFNIPATARFLTLAVSDSGDAWNNDIFAFRDATLTNAPQPLPPSPRVVSLSTDVLGPGTYAMGYTDQHAVELINKIFLASAGATAVTHGSGPVLIDFSPYVASDTTAGDWGSDTHGRPLSGSPRNLWLPGESNEPHAGFGAHANKFITFDLEDIREDYNWEFGLALRLTGTFGTQADISTGTDYGHMMGGIWLDGKLAQIIESFGGQPGIPFDISIIPDTRYLTMAFLNESTGYSWDDGAFRDVNLELTPEPGSLALLGIGLAAIARRRRRRK